MDEKNPLGVIRDALYQLALMNLAMTNDPSLPRWKDWAFRALSPSLGTGKAPAPPFNTGWHIAPGVTLKIGSELEFVTTLNTLDEVASVWSLVRGPIVETEQFGTYDKTAKVRVEQLTKHYHAEISRMEEALAAQLGIPMAWYPAKAGLLRSDVPDVAVKSRVTRDGQTLISCQRKVVTAANQVILKDGTTLVIAGARHFSHCMHRVLDVMEGSGLIDRKGRLGLPDRQGFVDQYDDYHSRRDAYIIANAYGRIDDAQNGSDDELFSEGLH